MKRTRSILERPAFDGLLAAIRARGYATFGPVARGTAITWTEVSSAADLPAGCTDEQEPGRYRLNRGGGAALFGHTVGPDSLKKHFLPPSLALFTSRRKKGSVEYADAKQDVDGGALKPAFIGARACDIAALEILDRVMIRGPFPDPRYAEARKRAFIVAVNCTAAGGTCFCSSMGTGPECRAGYDIALTEVATNGDHYFVCEQGSKAGGDVLAAAGAREAAPGELARADDLVKRAAAGMGRRVDTKDLAKHLRANFEHPRWTDVAKRCLTCANCTMVCPTCFCTTVEDAADLAGSEADRRRTWDTCFSTAHSYIHGGSVRPSPRARYRQWLTHKFDTWKEQFGTPGCTGCGRCITWCPAGIDITEEIHAIRNGGPAGPR